MTDDNSSDGIDLEAVIQDHLKRAQQVVHEVVGVDEATARKTAELARVKLRVIARDGVHSPYTLDERFDRVDIELVDGKVVRGCVS